MLSTFPARLGAHTSKFVSEIMAESSFDFQSHDEPPFLSHPIEQASSNSGSETSNPVHVTPIEPDRKKTKTLNSGSDETGLGSITDERKRRRMISNRESARRSRMRKQKHVENLRNNLTRLKAVNRELKNRVQFAAHQNRFICGENEHLKSELVMLRKTLWDMRQVLLVRQFQQRLNPNNYSAWPCNNVTTSFNDQERLIHHSLITQL